GTRAPPGARLPGPGSRPGKRAAPAGHGGSPPLGARRTPGGLPAPCTVKVLPNLRPVRRLRHQLGAFFLRPAGPPVGPRTGQGREFDRLREYVPGDDFRNLAWKSSARRGKLIVRESRVERSQDVLFCVDRGHRMAARVGDLTRNDHAVNAAVLTAYLCN